MNASRPALPELSLAAWSRTARPVRLASIAATPARRADPDDRASERVEAGETDQVDDLLFGCSAAVLMAMPLIIATAALIG